MSTRASIIVAFVVWLIAGGLVASAAWNHNPQSAIHGEDGIAVFHLLVLVLVWGAPAAGLVFVVLESVRVVIDVIRQRSRV